MKTSEKLIVFNSPLLSLFFWSFDIFHHHHRRMYGIKLGNSDSLATIFIVNKSVCSFARLSGSNNCSEVHGTKT